jgi:VanZ family protein
MHKQKLTIISFAAGIAWFVFITVLLMIPSKFPEIIEFDLIGTDKLVHLTFFFLLVYLLEKPILKLTDLPVQKWLFYISLFGIFYGIAVEYIQKYFIPNRSFDVGDIIADAVGSIAAYIVGMVLRKRYLKK